VGAERTNKALVLGHDQTTGQGRKEAWNNLDIDEGGEHRDAGEGNYGARKSRKRIKNFDFPCSCVFGGRLVKMRREGGIVPSVRRKGGENTFRIQTGLLMDTLDNRH